MVLGDQRDLVMFGEFVQGVYQAQEIHVKSQGGREFGAGCQFLELGETYDEQRFGAA